MIERVTTDGLGGAPGLCASCVWAILRPTRRGTTYLRCGRAAWDERLAKYPGLPVRTCVGYEPGVAPGDAEQSE